jgi:hypothetical protein
LPTGTAGVVDTGGNVNTGGKLPPVSTTLAANNGNNIRLLTSLSLFYYTKVFQ